MDIELVSTDELLEEIKSRAINIVIIQTYQCEEGMVDQIDFKGSTATCLGLTEYAKMKFKSKLV